MNGWCKETFQHECIAEIDLSKNRIRVIKGRLRIRA